jgi:hypothetical protein
MHVSIHVVLIHAILAGWSLPCFKLLSVLAASSLPDCKARGLPSVSAVPPNRFPGCAEAVLSVTSSVETITIP